METRGRSEERRGKNVQSVLQHYNITTADWLCWKRVKREKQRCVGCQAWKVLGRWEDGEDGGGRREKERQGEGQGKLEKERQREWWTSEIGEGRGVGHFREPWDLAVV